MAHSFLPHPRAALLLLLVLLLPLAVAAQTIYKCRAPNGTVVYSQRSCDPGSEERIDLGPIGWKVMAADGFDSAIGEVATLENDEAYAISIYRIRAGAVWMRFALAPTVGALLDHALPPSLSIDANPAHDLAATRRQHRLPGAVPSYQEAPRRVDFLIWHGQEEEGRALFLRQLMEGRSLRVRYRLQDDEIPHSVDFQLSGAGPTIAKVLGIEVDYDPAREAQLAEYRKAIVEASQVCMGQPGFRTCLEQAEQCSDENRGNISAFQDCFAARREGTNKGE